MRLYATFVLVLFILLTIACATEPQPAPPTPDVEATVTAMVEALPTQPPAPTLAALPTYTPVPTATAYPTYTPPPSATPYPTLEPLATLEPPPTHTPYPTQTPLPTYTPQPTMEALPTHTPYPTPTARPPVVRQVQNNWQSLAAVNGSTEYAAVGTNTDGDISTPWVLWIRCDDNGEPGIYLSDAFTRIFREGTDRFTEQLLLRADGDTSESDWIYFATDYFGAEQPYNVFGAIKNANRLVIEIPTAGDGYVVEFNVAGLSHGGLSRMWSPST